MNEQEVAVKLTEVEARCKSNTHRLDNSMVNGKGFSDEISGSSIGLYGAGFYLTGTNNVKFTSIFM